MPKFKSSRQYHCNEAEIIHIFPRAEQVVLREKVVALGINSASQSYAFKSYTEERMVKFIAFKLVTIYRAQLFISVNSS
ncbi:hypothetical protein T11_11973 [Trichinella zimbabwensis]|uniref:Uncharacterized protein n=1 Tax=Trichinella zimbabwensis TaxID=268475 RepID=A0A0V1HCU0_9BILA|nr:hypothetical protein T11_11973 [Trichinella zimbabwensis]